MEILEDRIVPVSGKALISLNMATPGPVTTIGGSPTKTVQVFIDFDNQHGTDTQGPNGGLAGGSFYVIYDPAVLSISETSASLGADITLPAGTLIPAAKSYQLQVASGFSTGVVAIGLTHSGSNFTTGAQTGHLISLNFHVLQTAPIGSSTLLDLQGTYIDLSGNTHTTTIQDQKTTAYA